MEYYHFTSYDNLSSIAEKGLIPKIGDRSKSVNEDRKAVFFSLGMRGAIRMYSSMQYYYDEFHGEKGKSLIEYNLKEIKMCEDFIEQGRYLIKEELTNEIAFRKQQIELVKFVMNFESFEDFIRKGCYLSVDRFRSIDDQDEKDCVYKGKVIPSRISVLGLFNRETEEYINSREAVLAHFMSVISNKCLLRGITNRIEAVNLYNLYESKAKEIEKYSMSNDYWLYRIPISEYVDSSNNIVDYIRKRS